MSPRLRDESKRQRYRGYSFWPEKEYREYFQSKADRDPESGCLLWRKVGKGKGYGWFRYRGNGYGAHVVAWILDNGPVPEGMQVNHHCDVRRCIELTHLYAGTAKQNTNDATRRGRMGWQRRVYREGTDEDE